MIRRIVLIAGALVAGCQAEKATEPVGPDGFAYSASVEPQGSASLQKVELPAAALIAFKRTDLGDVRIFDGRGKVLPIARLDAAGDDAQQTREVPLYPIAGTAAAPGNPAVSIEL
ncbi:MAG TPA: DUF3999 family protein, partial [Novosphingobium sp.]|nr:DUF3999 family protein [Novosphingobium sp.]